MPQLHPSDAIASRSEKPWALYLDDLRNPEDTYSDFDGLILPEHVFTDVPDLSGAPWTIARSTEEALRLCSLRGLPRVCSFDHDLGELTQSDLTTPAPAYDTTMIFLSNLFEMCDSGEIKLETFPDFRVHSANPVGAKNISSFMTSWKKSLDLP